MCPSCGIGLLECQPKPVLATTKRPRSPVSDMLNLIEQARQEVEAEDKPKKKKNDEEYSEEIILH